MDNIEDFLDNAIEEYVDNIDRTMQEANEFLGEPRNTEENNQQELTEEDIDAILNEAANELGVEIPNIVESEHNIEPNSPTILLDETHSRFSDADWASKITEQSVVLGGCGGIGRFGNLN